MKKRAPFLNNTDWLNAYEDSVLIGFTFSNTVRYVFIYLFKYTDKKVKNTIDSLSKRVPCGSLCGVDVIFVQSSFECAPFNITTSIEKV